MCANVSLFAALPWTPHIQVCQLQPVMYYFAVFYTSVLFTVHNNIYYVLMFSIRYFVVNYLYCLLSRVMSTLSC